MSFRIDDILKSEEKKVDDGARGPHRGWEAEGNILQETLMQYNEYPSYCQGRKFFGGYDIYSPFGALDHYNKFALSKYTAMANRMWPMYPGAIPSILPFSYQHYIKRKGGQVRFTATQTDALERRFRTHKYLSPEDRRVLADSLKLSDRQVKTWFQNRRAKWRRSNSVSSNGDRIQDCDSETETDLCEDEEKSPKTN